MGMYEGRKALVTGSASGIGKSLVEHLVNNGARVICCDINAEAGQAAVKEVNARRSSPAAWFMKLNVTSWEENLDAFRRAEEILGEKVDFVFANAGTTSGNAIFTQEDGKPSLRSLEVNSIGVLYTMQVAINHFRKYGGGGSIIATTSMAGLYSFKMDPAYAMSKHAVTGLVRSACMMVEGEGIYINAVAPASVESGIMPGYMVKHMAKLGLATSKESIIKAFDVFLTPGCKLSGQIAMPINEKLHILEQPYPPDFKFKAQL